MILYTQLYCIIFKIKSLFSKYSIAVYTRLVEFTIDSSAAADPDHAQRGPCASVATTF